MSFDEAADQIVRNLQSVGIDLAPHVAVGHLQMYSVRTQSRGVEQHLIDLQRQLAELRPAVLVLDPISALAKSGAHVAALHASLRLLDYAKALGISVLCTSLLAGDAADDEATAMEISTIADTWIHLAYVVRGGSCRAR